MIQPTLQIVETFKILGQATSIHGFRLFKGPGCRFNFLAQSVELVLVYRPRLRFECFNSALQVSYLPLLDNSVEVTFFRLFQHRRQSLHSCYCVPGWPIS